jgi:endoglucanase
VNLSNWLQHGRPSEPARYAPDAADWRLIRALGFLHVRILVDPDAVLGERGLPRPEALAELRDTVAAAADADLLVVIGLQLPPPLKQRLARSEPDRHALAGTWSALAAALRAFAPEQLLLEPINETEDERPLPSRGLQAFLAARIREQLPGHTLVAGGHRHAGVAELAALAPLDDRNVVYGFHFYEPHEFTHQGATWGPPLWPLLRKVPYPSSPERVAPLLAAARPEARDALRWHGEQRWDRARIESLLDRAAQWGRQHGVPVWCSEFGVLRPRAIPADRAAWLRDVRESLEARGIGWTHWDYAGDFGVVTGPRGRRKVDAATAAALGLKSPSP